VHARLFALGTSALVALVLVSSGFGRVSAGACSSGTLASTASYRMALDIGSQEGMYLPSEVKARHLKTGEIMLGGEMSMIGTPPAGTRVYHLEVHICNKAGAVVTKLKPAIVVGRTMLPAAIMIGIGAPASDYHYGNDIALKPAAKITVKVTVKGELAVFHATVPKS
jgi:hypothetical protein